MAITKRDYVEIGREYEISASEAEHMFDVYDDSRKRATVLCGHRNAPSDDKVREDIHLVMAMVAARRDGRISEEQFHQFVQALQGYVLEKTVAALQARSRSKSPGFFSRLLGRR